MASTHQNLCASSKAGTFGDKAYSLLEVTIAVAVLTVLGGLAVSSFFTVSQSSKREKLVSDVTALNSAVAVYVASGGSLGTLSDPQQVVDKLKTVVTLAEQDRMTGLSQSVVDHRLTLVTTTAIPDEDFAEWNPTSGRFEVVSNGSPTQTIRIKEFAIGTAPATVATEARAPTMKYSQTSGWIWDHQNYPPDNARLEPTPIALASYSPPLAPPATPAPPPPAPAQILNPPLYSLPGAGLGGNPWTPVDFPLSVTLSNPNPVGSSDIVFWINSNAPAVYAGQTLSIGPNDSVSAYADSLDTTQWTDSFTAQEVYTEVIANPSINFTMSVSVSSP